jgi:hypothetical protein
VVELKRTWRWTDREIARAPRDSRQPLVPDDVFGLLLRSVEKNKARLGKGCALRLIFISFKVILLYIKCKEQPSYFCSN